METCNGSIELLAREIKRRHRMHRTELREVGTVHLTKGALIGRKTSWLGICPSNGAVVMHKV